MFDYLTDEQYAELDETGFLRIEEVHEWGLGQTTTIMKRNNKPLPSRDKEAGK